MCLADRWGVVLVLIAWVLGYIFGLFHATRYK
jgi:hypothetical protein